MSEPTAFDALMHEVCVSRGWCGSIIDGEPRHVTYFLPSSGDVTADQFVAWLFAADGVDPHEDWGKWQSHYEGLRDAFVRYMGGDIAGADRLRWSGN